jgi:uncharacterized membrane protein YphA (DoxX/SURF4 family)
MRPPQVIEGFSHLGYPVYFAAILGVWKVLGAITIVAPRFPRLKEWAYAGIAFDLSGAALSSAAVGDGAGNVIAPLVLLAIVVASWALRPESRVLPRQKTAAAPDGTAVHGRSASFA